MAAEDGLIFRPLRNNDSTLVTPYPEAFHVQNDITVNGKADKFTRQLSNALRTRGLLRACTDREITYDDVAAANRGADPQEIRRLYDNMSQQRQILMNAI